jgi:hypothetical protein
MMLGASSCSPLASGYFSPLGSELAARTILEK